ncbi:MAG: chromosome segregation protein SMC [Acidobacteriota bacterium]
MLRLKSLQIHGFKSFADPVQVLFPAGITAVVGPNGCGKSNISDALGWTLGLQTARGLRGQKMEDFIFAGTRRRKAAGLAEAELVLVAETDEARRLLQELGLDGDEVTIGRKLYRSGEGYYSLNGRRVRLMDIHQLLERVGLGFAGYAMIAQGSIEEFLTAKPLERRALIEEAAQISGYKNRRRNAEMKLQMAQQNLVRVSDIIAEVERQLRSLQRQAAKAKRFKKLQEEYRELLRIRTRREAVRLAAEKERLAGELKAAFHQEEELRSGLESREAAVEQSRSAREEVERRLEEIARRKSEVELALERTESTVFHSLRQIQRLESEVEVGAQERERLERRREDLQTELAGQADRFRELEEERERLTAAVREVKGAREACAREVQGIEERLEELRQRLMQFAAEKAAVRNLKEQALQRERRIEADVDRLFEERRLAQERLEQAEERRDELQSALEAKEQAGRDLQEALAAKEDAVRRARRAAEEAGEEENRLRDQLVALNERLHSLQELEISRSNYSEGVKKALNYLSRTGSVGIAGTLADAVETDPRFERVVEEFLDEELEYILVENLEEGIKAVGELKGVKAGKCAFLGLRSSNGFGKVGVPTRPLPEPAPEAGVFGPLIGLVRMRPEVQEAFLRVHPDRAEAVVVSDLDRALELAHEYPEQTFITLQGESLTPRGLVAGAGAGGERLGILALKRQLRELEKRVAKQQEMHRAAVLRREEAEKGLAKGQQELEELRRSLHETEKATLRLRHNAEEAQAEADRLRRRVANLEAETEQLEFELLDLRNQLEQLDGRLASAEEKERELQQELEGARRNQGGRREKLEKLQAEESRLRTERELVQEKLVFSQNERRRTEQELEEVGRALERLAQRAADNQRQIQELQEAVTEARVARKELEEEKQALLAAEGEARAEVERYRKSAAEQQEEVRALRERLARVQEARSRLEVEQARVETQWEHLAAQCREQLHASLEELQGEAPAESEAEKQGDLEERFESLRSRLENFGPINLTALEEFEETQQRYELLTQQRADIEKAIADTTKAIQDLNRRSLLQFREAFEAINANFKEMFQRLFGGGDCGMSLLDEEDMLESGIDVYAQPPGKRLQNVMLLSGGEKALTVFALLMGIFLYRPSRFCVLDEVDAPLDEANVVRFNQLVREMSSQTQFVIITHNKRTMENADTLYGVTMEEPGVSKLVSARI